jgi:hypothetical protein
VQRPQSHGSRYTPPFLGIQHAAWLEKETASHGD